MSTSRTTRPGQGRKDFKILEPSTDHCGAMVLRLGLNTTLHSLRQLVGYTFIAAARGLVAGPSVANELFPSTVADAGERVHGETRRRRQADAHSTPPHVRIVETRNDSPNLALITFAKWCVLCLSRSGVWTCGMAFVLLCK